MMHKVYVFFIELIGGNKTYTGNLSRDKIFCEKRDFLREQNHGDSKSNGRGICNFQSENAYILPPLAGKMDDESNDGEKQKNPAFKQQKEQLPLWKKENKIQIFYFFVSFITSFPRILTLCSPAWFLLLVLDFFVGLELFSMKEYFYL